LQMFWVGTRRPSVSRKEGQHFVPLKTLIKNKASKWRLLLCSVSNYRSDISHPGRIYYGNGLQIFIACAQVYWNQ
jgi:hypothetical protein